MNFKLNPTLKEFGSDKTLFHLAWSVWWRGVALLWGVVLAAYFIVGFYEGFTGV